MNYSRPFYQSAEILYSSLMTTILAIHGSPQRKGNTGLLLQKAVQRDREAGAKVGGIVLLNLKMSSCLEVYDKSLKGTF